MKKAVLFAFLFLASINLVSAQSMISDLLNKIDQSMVILSSIFIISFSLLFFALSKTAFKTNGTIAGIIAAILAFLITYGVNKTGFDFPGIFL